MRPFELFSAFAERLLLVALFGAVACVGCASAGPRAAGAGGSGASGGCSAIAEPNAWASWVMPNPVRSGLPNPASYTLSDSKNQVTDAVTGLVWQRQLDARSFSWQEAKQYCACLSIDGEAGFRLPSRIELASIADWTTAHPALDSHAFPNAPSASFWSSSLLSGDAGLAWLVDFDSSHTTYSDPGYRYAARCVRAQPSSTSGPPTRYAIASGTVFDTQTRLTWQQELSATPCTWGEAMTYCSELSLNGGGWRAPGIGELQTLVDESTNPSLDTAAFPLTPSEYFWSSSLVVSDPARAWTAFFANGSTYSFVITSPRNIRCVR